MRSGNGSMKLRAGLISAAMIMGALLAGCASNSVREMNAIQQNISMLYERVQALERRVDGMDGQSQKRADLYSRLEELQLKVGALNGRIEEEDHKIEQLSRALASSPPTTPCRVLFVGDPDHNDGPSRGDSRPAGGPGSDASPGGEGDFRPAAEYRYPG